MISRNLRSGTDSEYKPDDQLRKEILTMNTNEELSLESPEIEDEIEDDEAEAAAGGKMVISPDSRVQYKKLV